MEKELKEEKILILKRVPPGDRWIFAGAKEGNIRGDVYPSLTDALEAWYQYAGDTSFYMDARNGMVSIVKEQEVEVPLKRFSLYGEE
jgi:hypothetical protein